MIKIRKAIEDDLSQIFEIEKEATSPPWAYEAFLGELRRKDSFFIVVVDDTAEGCVIGYAIIRQVGDDKELLKIAVKKSVRGNGIGDMLMSTVLDHAEENTHKAIFLEVRVGNIAATRLYEKYGFKSVRIRKDYYNNPYEDAIVMVRGDMW